MITMEVMEVTMETDLTLIMEVMEIIPTMEVMEILLTMETMGMIKKVACKPSDGFG